MVIWSALVYWWMGSEQLRGVCGALGELGTEKSLKTLVYWLCLTTFSQPAGIGLNTVQVYRIIVKRVASLFGLPGFSGRPEQLKREERRRQRGQFGLRALLIATMIAGVLGRQAGDYVPRREERARKRIQQEIDEFIKQRQKEIGGGWSCNKDDELDDGKLDWSMVELGEWKCVLGTWYLVLGTQYKV